MWYNTHRVARALVLVLIVAAAHAQQPDEIIHDFADPSRSFDGQSPYSGLLIDAAGNLYGTTSQSTHGWGIVFELTPLAAGGWKENIVHTFGFRQGDGGTPLGGLIRDTRGNLYGTAVEGGAYGNGVIYELTPIGGGIWDEVILYSFTGGSDGGGPISTLAIDSKGSLYGATTSGGIVNCGSGSESCGTIFELSPGVGGVWREKVLHAFTGGEDGAVPRAGVVLDAVGNFYGTAGAGGIDACTAPIIGCGTLFKMTFVPKTGWIFKLLHKFNGWDGAGPWGTLSIDNTGKIYGTTSGGGQGGYGVVFELTDGSSGWKEQVLHAFTGGDDGGSPWYEQLTFDAAGNVYGTTEMGGPNNNGVVFELIPSTGGTWAEKVLHSFGPFNSGDGGNPYAGVVLDKNGSVYGTTFGGGQGAGTVFEILRQIRRPDAQHVWSETHPPRVAVPHYIGYK